MAENDTYKGYLRLNHFHGQRLETEDFELGEKYHLEKRKLHNRCLHGWGIIPRFEGGLKVVARRRGDMSIDISPGYAIDGNGNDMVLSEPRIVTIDPGKQLPQLPATAHLVLKFVDEPVDFVVNKINPKFKGHRRIHETVRVDVEAKEPDPRDGVELCRVLVTGDIREVTDARDPNAPAPGEIDLRYVPTAGVTGTTVGSSLVAQLRAILAELRQCLGHLARRGIHSARDMRAACMTLAMMLESRMLDASEIIKGVRLLLELAEEMRADVDVTAPELNGVREWEQWKEIVDGLSGAAREAKPIPGDIANLLNRLATGVGNLVLAATVKPPEPKKPMPVKKGEPAPEEKPPETGKKADAVEVTWEQLEQLSTLPPRIYINGKNYDLVDQIELGNRQSELEHAFGIEGAKEDWVANQALTYPDGVKVTVKGRAHVGGTSKWTMKRLKPGKDMILAKRIDFVRGDLVARIEIDGKPIGDWAIRGSDRKHRWRNWLFAIPGTSVAKEAVECRQVAVEADRDINMYGLWFYQAVE